MSAKSIKDHQPTESTLQEWIGGSGFAAKILYENTDRDTEPFGQENYLIFMNGPFTTTRIPLSGRHEVVAKSPASFGYGEADVGGLFGTELKKCGFDGLVFYGKSEKPVYLDITDDQILFKDAQVLWGLDTYEVDGILKKENDPKAITCSIGQAGERLARMAGVMHDGQDGRPAARCGLGAVMGSKNLKAMIARGSKKIPVAHEQDLAKSIRELGPQVVKNTKSLHDFGTSGATVTIEQLGDLPIRNWQQGSFEEGAQKISGQTMAKTILKGNYYCGACVVGCGREVEVKSGPFATRHSAGPEYETVACLGSMCLVDNLEAIAKAHELCNRYGLDVISTGNAVAFAMECYDRKIISENDTGGVKLEWGDAQAVIEMVHKIGRREDIGWLLGEGIARAAQKLGHGSEEFAQHVKGLEFPAHDPRAYNSIAIGYATSNRGACHLQGMSHVFERTVTMPELGWNQVQDRFGAEGKGEFLAKCQNLMSMMDSLKLCKFNLFGGIKIHHMITWLKNVTGWDFDLDGFMRTGERMYNLKRLYNVRCGKNRKDDTIPIRVFKQKRGSGGAAENLPPHDKLLE
ncbi:MAG: aldehyde ferredoxin oxidoreductase family protein, partial [Candidatus Bathyarchaeia archaeon]